MRCIIRMKNVDQDGKRLHDIELQQRAGDDVLFVINPGPHHAINHSSIWNVTEEELQKLEKIHANAKGVLPGKAARRQAARFWQKEKTRYSLGLGDHQ